MKAEHDKDGNRPLERIVRRGDKTMALFAALRNGPIKMQEAQKIVGSWSNLQRLILIGVLRKYEDENPDYAAGVRFSRPICSWVELKDQKYVPMSQRGNQRKLRRKAARLEKAIAVLMAEGYSIQAPNAWAKRRLPRCA